MAYLFALPRTSRRFDNHRQPAIMTMRRPRLPLLASFISLVIIALFVYTSPNLSSLDGIYRFRFAGGTSEGGDEQISGAIHSVNAVPTTTPWDKPSTFNRRVQEKRP
jgi:hypothetical protein